MYPGLRGSNISGTGTSYAEAMWMSSSSCGFHLSFMSLRYADFIEQGKEIL